MVLAMSMLPTCHVDMVWAFLRVPPTTCDPDVQRMLQSFATYVDETWIQGDYPPATWTHFDNLGPKTTNLAEGFHNSLNVRFGIPHPSMQSFLLWLQKLQYEVQCRGIQLAASRPAKQPSATYEQLRETHARAKLTYLLNVGQVFATLFPDPSAWVLFRQHAESYLSRTAYLIGAQ